MSHLLELLFDEEYADARLIASCGTEIPVHRNILCLQCPTFKAMYDDRWKQPGELPTARLDYDVQTIRHILFYFYIGRLYDTRNCVRSRPIWISKTDDTGVRSGSGSSNPSSADPRDSLTCLNDDPELIINLYRIADYLGFERLQKSILAYLRGKIVTLAADHSVMAGLLRVAYTAVDFAHDGAVVGVLERQVGVMLVLRTPIEKQLAEVLDEFCGTEWRSTHRLPKRVVREETLEPEERTMVVVERPKTSE